MNNFQTHAYLLHQRALRGSAILADFYTAEFGRVSAIVQGVKSRRSEKSGLLQPFVPLTLMAYWKGELARLQDVEQRYYAMPLKGQALYCGLYINELCYRLLSGSEQNMALFAHYEKTVNRLRDRSESVAIVLREFELDFLKYLGYEINFSDQHGRAFQENASYTYGMESGFCKVSPCQQAFLGKDLIALSQSLWESTAVQMAAKRLTRQIFAILLDGKPLMSRALFQTKA